MGQEMRYRHLIYLGNSYTRGYRVALHRAIGASERPPDRKPILRALKGLDFSYHTVVTGSPSWESVRAFDPYFEGVMKVDSVEEFRDAVLEDRILSKEDIETYINSVADVSRLKLYLLIRRCNQSCMDQLGYELYDPNKKDCPTAHILNPSISANRILASEDGYEKLRIIDSVLSSLVSDEA